MQCITGLIINPVTLEFAGFKGPFLILAQSIGLLVGAVFWGVGCDIWGRRFVFPSSHPPQTSLPTRNPNQSHFHSLSLTYLHRWSFNLTLLITGIFALSAGGAPTALALCALIATWNTGVGGNLPVDSAVFLEFVPASHQWLLTVLSIWWAVGQLVASLVAWPFIANFSCAANSGSTGAGAGNGTACTRAANMGWRYFLWTMGALMMVLFVLRFFVFKMYESPRYLVGRGRDAEAVEVVHQVARFNGKKSSLRVEMLRALDRGEYTASGSTGEKGRGRELDTSARGALARKMSVVDTSHVKALFATKKMAYSTSLLIVLWGKWSSWFGTYFCV